MEGISKVPMSSFFLLGLFLIVTGTAAQTDTSDMKCAALGADLSACVELFGVGRADLGIDVTPPRRCCTGLQQIKASVEVLGASRTCHCLRQSSIFRDQPNASINTAILDSYLASCSLALGVDITTDLSCLRI